MYWSQYPNLKYKPDPEMSKTRNHVSEDLYRLFLVEIFRQFIVLYKKPSNTPVWLSFITSVWQLFYSNTVRSNAITSE